MMGIFQVFSLMLLIGIPAAYGQETGTPRSSGPTPEAKSRRAPDFRLPARDGKTRTLADYRGKWLLLNFWATWCAPCREEMPALSAAQERWKHRSVAIVGVAMDSQGWQKVTPFLAGTPVKYDIVLGSPKVAREYAAGKVYPTTVVVNPEGKIIDRVTTALDERALDVLLEHVTSSAIHR